MKHSNKEKIKFGQAKVNVIGSIASCALVSGLSLVMFPSHAKAVNFIQPIDTFSGGTAIAGYSSITVLNDIGSGAYEGQRDIRIVLDPVLNNAVAGIGSSSGQDFYLLGVGSITSASTTARVNILYDGSTVTSNPNTTTPASFSNSINLTTTGVSPITGLRLQIFSTNDAKTGSNATFTVFNGTQTSSLTQALTLGNTGAYFLDFNFTNFAGSSSVFTNATAIRLDLALVADEFQPATVRFNFIDAVPFDYSHELGLVAIAGLFGAYKLRSRKSANIESEEVAEARIEE